MSPIKAAFSRLDRHVQGAMLAAANETVDLVGKRIQAGVPRLSGELADSMKVEHATTSQAIEATVSIGSPDEPGEAAAVEFGTAFRVATPFFRPACKPSESDFVKSLRGHIQNKG